MSKINGDKARHNRRARARAQMRARNRLLLKPVARPASPKKPA